MNNNNEKLSKSLCCLYSDCNEHWHSGTGGISLLFIQKCRKKFAAVALFLCMCVCVCIAICKSTEVAIFNAIHREKKLGIIIKNASIFVLFM